MYPDQIYAQNIKARNFFAGKIKKVAEVQRANVTSANFLRNDETSSSDPEPPQELAARIYVLEDVLEKCSASLDKKYFDLNSIHSRVYVPPDLRITLNVKVGGRVIMRMIEEAAERPKPSSMDIFPSDQSITTETFANYVESRSRCEPLLLNSRAMISLDDGGSCVVRMSPADCDYATIDATDMESLVVHVRSVLNSSNAEVAEVAEDGAGKNSKLEKISTR